MDRTTGRPDLYCSPGRPATIPAMPDAFALVRTVPVPALGLDAQEWRHPCGAVHWHLACADEHRAFACAFRTPPTDSTGLPHILEHTTLCGSTVAIVVCID